MALTDYKITETERDTLGITTANDQYINQAGTIKARFDALPKTIVNKYNQLIDALITETVTTTNITVTASSITTLVSAKAFKRNGVIYVQVTGEASGNDINAATPTNEQSGSGLFSMYINGERIKPSSAIYVGTSWTMPASSTQFTSAWRSYPYLGADGFVRISTGTGTSKAFKYFGVNMIIPESAL